MVATALKMPISGTHSIVGATIGFSIVLRGWDSIKWFAMLRIVISWFASPLLSGLISSLIYLLISRTVIRKVSSCWSVKRISVIVEVYISLQQMCIRSQIEKLRLIHYTMDWRPYLYSMDRQFSSMLPLLWLMVLKVSFEMRRATMLYRVVATEETRTIEN